MSHIVTGFVLVFFIINFLFIIFVLFFERKESSRRFAWVLMLTFLPFVGMILYIVFSGHFFTKTKKMAMAKKHIEILIEPMLQDQLNFFKKPTTKLPNTVITQFENLVELNIKNARSPVTFTDSVKVYTTGKAKFTDLIEDLENAKESIYMQYFIIRYDDIGCKIMDILCKKAKEGLDVKLLYDDMGCFSTPRKFFLQLDTAGGHSLPFFPVKWTSPLGVNFRNHRKIVVIDKTIGYTGGFNIGNEYLSQGYGFKNKNPVVWRDTHLRMTGSCVLSLLTVFLIDWYSVASGKKALKKYPTPNGVVSVPKLDDINEIILKDLKTDITGDQHIPTQIVSSGPDVFERQEIRDMLIKMIMSAKSFVFIQTPYFTPDEPFIAALKIAVASGIDIRIMVPGQWDKFYVRAAANEFIREMLPLGIRFFAYPGFIHSKTMVVDNDLVTIGSTNIDNRSFELLFELNAIFYDKEFAQYNGEIFLTDQSKCTELKSQWFESRPIIQRAWWGFCKLLSPLM